MSKTQSANEEIGAKITADRDSVGMRRVTMTTAAGTAVREERSQFSEDPYLGATVDGRYLVEKVLGEGGMGIVYRCRHTIIDKLVAMKVLRADMARNEEVTERFLNEARSASSIGNPHIIDISDFGRLPDGATYFIMEFLDGRPLSDVLGKEKHLPAERLLPIAIQLAEGLGAAHEGGIIHRDLKPDNIFLLRRGSQTDFVKILDFGIAKATSTGSKLTQAGQVFGTPHYMSPEQAAGTTVDHRSDIYSVGVILYELSTGKLPFDAENFMAILTQHMYKAPPAFAEVPNAPENVPAELELVVLKCLEKDPGQRYQSMADLALDLGRLAQGILPEAATSRRSRLSIMELEGAEADLLAEKQSKRSPVMLGLVLGGLLAVGFLGVRALSPKPEPKTALIPIAAPTAAQVEQAPQKTTQPIAIAVSPLDARVFRGDEDLGQSPVVIEVGAEPVSLRISREGYETKELQIDATEPKVSVTLTKQKGSKSAGAAAAAARPSPTPAPAPPASKPAKRKPSSSADGIVNPWD